MKLSVYGTGYVGLVASVGFAKFGHEVLAVDVNQARIDGLNAGVCPLYEMDLPKLLKTQLKTSRLRFSSVITEAMTHAAVHLIAVGTPSLENGKADISQIVNVVMKIAKTTQQNGWIIIKSTVPVGTGDHLQATINQLLKNTPIQFNFSIR